MKPVVRERLAAGGIPRHHCEGCPLVPQQTPDLGVRQALDGARPPDGARALGHKPLRNAPAQRVQVLDAAVLDGKPAAALPKEAVEEAPRRTLS